ncbi:MAG: phosphopantetheine-binding protein, partial [Bacilli bacterium]|nr:phosphopantetheine-binding protein [Bacilli bacterium]
GADSLDAVELIMAIEDEFDVQVSDEAAQNIRKVSDIVEYLEKAK